MAKPPSGPRGREQQEQKRTDARATSLEAGRTLQRLLDAAPAAQVAKNVDAATLKSAQRVLDMAAGLEVHVPVGNVTDGDVLRRLEEIRQTLSFVQPRAYGDTLQLGDEVLVDILGYMNGDVFLAHTDTWYSLTPNKFLPGLFESLVGARVPDHSIIHVKLPIDYPVSAHAGRVAVFAVSIKQGRGRTLPDVDDPIFLPFVNRGAKTIGELKVQLRAEIVRERAQQMVEHAKLLLLRELYVKCMEDDVPVDLVDEELTRRWRETKGEPLIRQGVSIEEQRKSQHDFGSDPVNRAEARRTIWEYRVLEAIAAHHGIEVTEETLRPVLQSIFGNDVDLDGLLYKNPGLHKDLLKGLRMRRATDVLLKTSKIFFDAPPTPAGEAYKPLLPAKDRPKEAERLVFTAARGLARPSPKPEGGKPVAPLKK